MNPSMTRSARRKSAGRPPARETNRSSTASRNNTPAGRPVSAAPTAAPAGECWGEAAPEISSGEQVRNRGPPARDSRELQEGRYPRRGRKRPLFKRNVRNVSDRRRLSNYLHVRAVHCLQTPSTRPARRFVGALGAALRGLRTRLLGSETTEGALTSHVHCTPLGVCGKMPPTREARREKGKCKKVRSSSSMPPRGLVSSRLMVAGKTSLFMPTTRAVPSSKTAPGLSSTSSKERRDPRLAA
jgi:hypothetical protein